MCSVHNFFQNRCLPDILMSSPLFNFRKLWKYVDARPYIYVIIFSFYVYDNKGICPLYKIILFTLLNNKICERELDLLKIIKRNISSTNIIISIVYQIMNQHQTQQTGAYRGPKISILTYGSDWINSKVVPLQQFCDIFVSFDCSY